MRGRLDSAASDINRESRAGLARVRKGQVTVILKRRLIKRGKAEGMKGF